MLWYVTFWPLILYHVTLQIVDKSDILKKVPTKAKYFSLTPLPYALFFSFFFNVLILLGIYFAMMP